MHPKMKHLYVGIDTHKATSTAGIINCFNEKLGSITFNNDREGFTSLLKFIKGIIKSHFTPEENITPIYGLEGTNGLGHSLAMFLLRNRQAVKSVDANYTYSERRNKAIVSKSDEIDALCIAKVTLDKLNELPSFSPDDVFWTLKQLVKMRNTVIEMNISYKNKLHAQLSHHYPNYKEFFHNFDCKTALSLWETYPSPNLLKRISVTELANFMRKTSSKMHIVKAMEIFALIDKYDYDSLDFQPERNHLIKMLVRQIRRNSEELAELDAEINSLMDRIDYKLETFIGINKILAAKIASEVGNINRFNSPDKLARYCGVAPVEFSSGAKDKTVYNKYGNRQLNSYLFNVASLNLCKGMYRNRPVSPIFLAYYNKKLSEGKTKMQAISYVMRRIVNILYGMMKNKTEYRHPEKLSNECMERFNETFRDENDSS